MALRNEAAHESEVEFANLLLSMKDRDKCHFWQDAFTLLYGGTIEEVAARDKKFDWVEWIIRGEIQ